jgi:DNA-binding beta-propeller fold protein YncE
MPQEVRRATAIALAAVLLGVSLGCTTIGGGAKSGRKDPYSEYVWPPPPDKPRVKLQTILFGRADVESDAAFGRALMGTGPQSRFEHLRQPSSVAFDAEGRILVTDPGHQALFRFDRKGKRMDVLGTSGALVLKTPIGLTVGPDGTIYVADVGLRKVLAFDPEGKLVSAFGKGDELTNPADVALSPDRTKLFVADSKAHQIVVYDIATGAVTSTIGKRGGGEGEFAFPSALAFDREGDLLVVDQVNSRVQLLTPSGEFLDSFGGLGTTFGRFVRPKDVAVDDAGLIYVTDAAFNNLQIFDPDFRLLTFVGGGGSRPGGFTNAGGVAVRGDEVVVVDQLGRRVQVFTFLGPKTAE